MGINEKIETILLKNGSCSQEDIEQAGDIQKEYGGTIGNILLNLGAISEHALLDALSEQYSLSLLKDFGIENIEQVVLENISLEFLHENEIFPIFTDENQIIYAIKNLPKQISSLF